MRLNVLVSLLILAFCAPAHAQPQDRERDPAGWYLRASLARCSEIELSMERVLCFDEVVNHFRIGPDTGGAEAGYGLWAVKTEMSPVDDRETFYMTLESDLVVTLRHGTRIRPLLVARCNPNFLDAYIVWSVPLGDRQKMPVTGRLDREPAETRDWFVSVDDHATFHPDPVPFIKSMLEREYFVAAMMPPEEAPLEAHFNLGGFDEVVRTVKDKCGW